MNKRLFIILGVVALLAGGVFWCTMKRQKESVVTVPLIQSNQQGEMKTFESVKGEEGYVWFPVPELGIEVKVKKDIAGELIYKASNTAKGKDVVSAQFTTEKLLNIGERNGVKKQTSNGAFGCFVGTMTRFNMSKQQYIDMQKEVYGDDFMVQPVDIAGYFIEYTSPQSGCSNASDDPNYEQYLVTSWWGKPTSEYNEKFNTKENLQQSVRRLK